MTTRRDGSATPRIAPILRLLFVAVGLVSVILGYAGLDRYLHSPGPPQSYSHSPNDLVYFDLELFLLQCTPLALGGPYPWQLSVARFSAPSVALYAVAEIVVALSARRVHRAWLRRSRGHAVVFGTTRIASVVVERLRARGVRVLVVRPDTAARPAGLDTADDDRWTIVGGPASRRTLTDAGIRRASAVYACLDRIEDNAEVAYTIEAWRGGQRYPERVYASIDDLDLCTALKARRWSMAGAGRSHVDFFNRDELAAQTVVRRDRAALDDRAPHVAISGTGAFARSVLVELGRQWLSRTGEASESGKASETGNASESGEASESGKQTRPAPATSSRSSLSGRTPRPSDRGCASSIRSCATSVSSSPGPTRSPCCWSGCGPAHPPSPPLPVPERRARSAGGRLGERLLPQRDGRRGGPPGPHVADG